MQLGLDVGRLSGLLDDPEHPFWPLGALLGTLRALAGRAGDSPRRSGDTFKRHRASREGSRIDFDSILGDPDPSEIDFGLIFASIFASIGAWTCEWTDYM